MRRIGSDAISKPRPARGFVVFKWLVYSLLASNVALYAEQGTATETVDTAAWLVLLLLFEWETGGWPLSPRARGPLHAVRLLASTAIIWACVDYALQREWLDFANALTWLAVVLALELEVRIAPSRTGLHRVRRLMTWLLYAALGGFVVAWLLQTQEDVSGAWLDAWDATLWLAAFVAIELNVFASGTKPRESRHRARAAVNARPR